MSDTPTPMTDLESYQARGPYELKEHEVVNARFARTLERGLAEARAELTELRKDKERLAFIISEMCYIYHESDGYRLYWGDFENGGSRQHDVYASPEEAIDAAIDAARKEAEDGR